MGAQQSRVVDTPPDLTTASSSSSTTSSLASASSTSSSSSSTKGGAAPVITPFTAPEFPSLAAQLNTTSFSTSRTPSPVPRPPVITTITAATTATPAKKGVVTAAKSVATASAAAALTPPAAPPTGFFARLKGVFSKSSPSDATTPATPASTSSSWLPMPFASPSSEADESPSCVSSLSRRQRMMGFVICFALGCLCSLMSSMYVPLIVIRPAKFAFPYTVGNLLSISSTAFLIGPVAQLRSMFAPVRAATSIVYLISMVATLYCALHLRAALPTLLCTGVQLMAFLWYSASYIPFGRDLLRGCLTRTCQCLGKCL